MKQALTIDVELNQFRCDKDNVIVFRNREWVGVPKEEFLKEYEIELEDLRNQIKQFELKEAKMLNEIEKFKKALVTYGFDQFKGGK